ncbi:response regulator [Thermodesulfobacteriota bacterium]
MILKGDKHVYVNNRFLDMFGYESPNEIIGKPLSMIVHPDDFQRVSEIASRRQRGEAAPERYEIRCVRKDGTVIDVDNYVTKTIYLGEPVSLAYLRDITEHKKAENIKSVLYDISRAVNSTKNLDEHFYSIHQSLGRILDVTFSFIAFYDEEKDVMDCPFRTDGKYYGLSETVTINDVSKSGTIVSKIIETKRPTLLKEEQIKEVYTSSRMEPPKTIPKVWIGTPLINDILDFSKIEAGKMELEILDFDLRTAIEEIVALPALSAQEKGLEFAYEIDSNIPSLLRGDPGRQRQTIINLASNAVKFTEKGEVVIRVYLEEETEANIKIRFVVEDTGIGMTKDDLSRLFQSFHQADASTTRKYGGTGLGLAISKKLTELMGGEIGVESVKGKGSTFWFTVVFEKQLDVKEKELIPPANIRDKRILVVDDNKTNLQILQRYLEAWDFVCDPAWSGEMALTLMHAAVKSRAPYDIVITDMQMPIMDGRELGQRIKADPTLKDALLVVLSSHGMRGDAAEFKRIGFAGYLTKPIRRSQLFDCLVLVLSGKTQPQAKDSHLVTQHTIIEARKQMAHILIAEDNIVNRKLALRLLEKFGFRADAVANGREAVRSLEVIPYSVVLMDVQMPEMDGFEATRIIRDPDLKVLNHDVPIIAMTAHAMKCDKERCLEAGMDGYISKPINPEELLSAINKQLSITDNNKPVDEEVII